MAFVSIQELFKVGIGPSSSHTVGPMRAAKMFVEQLLEADIVSSSTRLVVRLKGSLAFTGKGHQTPKGIMLGLMRKSPSKVEPEDLDSIEEKIVAEGIFLAGQRYEFSPAQDIVFDYESPTPHHPNTLSFHLYDSNETELFKKEYYSVGGGFVVDKVQHIFNHKQTESTLPFLFSSAQDLQKICTENNLTIADVVKANEIANLTETALNDHIQLIDQVMEQTVKGGLSRRGTLPGGLGVERRAADLFDQHTKNKSDIPTEATDLASIFAIAVNEENAADARFVTAPTNGAAGVVPAVLAMLKFFHKDMSTEKRDVFFLTATAIGALVKINASISGADVGCQGEVGTASAMAAGGMTAVLGGDTNKILNAAEIALEHHLGMTCDPVGGLVQIPCIERNAFGAVKAINASRMALNGTGYHMISLDQAIETMRKTGHDMKHEYKETSLGGLALHVIEC